MSNNQWPGPYQPQEGYPQQPQQPQPGYPQQPQQGQADHQAGQERAACAHPSGPSEGRMKAGRHSGCPETAPGTGPGALLREASDAILTTSVSFLTGAFLMRTV